MVAVAGRQRRNLRFRDHDPDELAFYSKATVDIEYLYPFTAPDFGELEGVAHRGDYDLTQHTKHSGVKLDYFDQDLQLRLKEQGLPPEEVKAKSRYTPNVIEPASGLTRAVLVLLCECYRNEKGRPGTEEYFSFKPQFAPIKCGVFPLVNKDGMPESPRNCSCNSASGSRVSTTPSRRSAGGTPGWTRSARRSV